MENKTSIFESKEEYFAMVDAWKAYTKAEETKSQLAAHDYALYAALRGKDWRKHFAPHSHKTTIQALNFYLLKSKWIVTAPFGTGITMEKIEQLRALGTIEKWEI